MLLDFSDRTGTGIFSMVWSLPSECVLFGAFMPTSTLRVQSMEVYTRVSQKNTFLAVQALHPTQGYTSCPKYADQFWWPSFAFWSPPRAPESLVPPTHRVKNQLCRTKLRVCSLESLQRAEQSIVQWKCSIFNTFCSFSSFTSTKTTICVKFSLEQAN